MAQISKIQLSGSTNGRGISVVATATLGTTIHSSLSTTAVYDEVWLYASNPTASAVLLTIEFGGAVTTSDVIKLSIASQTGLTLVVPGLILRGTGSAANQITAYAATTAAIELFGYVNRITL